MKTSPEGVAFIAREEGVVTKAYRDAAGVLTVGVGHTASAGPPTPRPGMAITRQEAFQILARDLARFEARVNAVLPGVTQPEFDGAVSFDFNTGAIHKASWVKAFKRGDRNAARKGLMLWVKAGGRTVKGLVNRREAEARLIFGGDYGRGSDTGRPEPGAATPVPPPRPSAPMPTSSGKAAPVGATAALLAVAAGIYAAWGHVAAFFHHLIGG
jgi:lysozyme